MGITIHFRGTIDDLNQVEEFEDRVLDLVFSLGGKATVWRSWDDSDRTRVMRGLMIEMAPGQETLSLLISPEGYLTPLFQIEEAEQAPFDEPPYCFCKTQFGSVQGHVAIVHLLDAMRQNFFNNLEVVDEGEFHETRDANVLADKMKLLGNAIGSLAEGLREHGLSDEAAEDPNIIAARIERIATLVYQTMSEDSGVKHSPESLRDEATEVVDTAWNEPSLGDEVAIFDRMRRHNNMRNERMARRIEESTAAGMSAAEAIELAMREQGLTPPNSHPAGPETSSTHFANRNEGERTEDNDSQVMDETDRWVEIESQSIPATFSEVKTPNVPDSACKLAEQFLLTVMDLANNDATSNSFFSTVVRSATDIAGGLAQATCQPVKDRSGRALAISQLKRSLAGHAFARGAVFGLLSDDAIDATTSALLQNQLAGILKLIHDLTEHAWDESEFA